MLILEISDIVVLLMDNKILEDLNPEQRKAVTFDNGPFLIIAGAGTGKTTVITKRVAWLILSKKAKLEEILAVTFTEKAAGEMEERVDRLLPMGYLELWISTFHSFGERILKNHALEIGLPDDFKLLNQTEQNFLIRQNFDKFNLDYYRPLGNPTKFISALVKHFSRTKDEEIWPEQYLEFASELKQNLDNMLSGETGVKNSKFETRNPKQIQNTKYKIQNKEKTPQEVSRLEEIANAYHTYQQLLLENNALDFGDLINYTLKLFRQRPHILEKYRQQFKYILVDEFQDTNWAQYELIKLLAAPKNNLTVCADDDQCLPPGVLISTPEGEKKIEKIKENDEIITAVGKGYLSISKITKVFRNKKKARFLTIKTKRGYQLEVTDNHKMFCFTPKVSDKKFYYVYLMHKQGLGWRLGISNNLVVKLRLERSADKIIALRAFKTEEEARYFEILLTLKYGIPTSVFKERNRGMIQGKWIEKLYKELDVEKNVKKLAQDLEIDLNAHHHCLGAVNRGNKQRIKINLNFCHRRYKSKYSKKGFLQSPWIRHQVSLETSDKIAINKLKKEGFKLNKAKKGMKFRLETDDIKQAGVIATKLQKLTNGILENGFVVGKTNITSQKALVMPAGNVLSGLFIPVFIPNKEIIYDQVIDIKEKIKESIVYDLEVDKTHNFIADGIVVHNSIYKFRGASVSNVLQFKKDYSQSKEVVLVKNYRSKQNILDLAYKFIQLNNPNRLEWQLGKKI